jgi:hypothetical protein
LGFLRRVTRIIITILPGNVTTTPSPTNQPLFVSPVPIMWIYTPTKAPSSLCYGQEEDEDMEEGIST